MMFSTKLSKFGKGVNLSAIMETSNKISIYYFEKTVTKKEVNISETNLSLERTNETFPYLEVIPLGGNFFVSRLDKSIGIIKNEE